ncbi:MAG: poly(3-hydroxybutyrate) depolymerase [Gaiellaceae bacterium]|nr:poly(3-hydroxybutyrate) depolymerase [Gaiellaceae bacterium]
MTATLDTPAAAAANLASRLATTWFDVAGQYLTIGARYWADAVERGATPVDVFDDAAAWMRTVGGRREPTWSLPNTVVATSPITRLRDFSLPGATAAIPTLILPPQAGHHSCIVDYSERQSQVGVALAAGRDRLFVVEWLEATAATAHSSIDDYVGAVRDAIAQIGEPVHLVGDCQGGWLAAIVTALDPASVASLTVGAAPIDFHAGEGPLLDHVALSAGRGGAPYRALVDAGGGVLRGEVMVAGFVALAPEDEIRKQLDLLLSLGDPAYVARYNDFEDWFKHTQDIAGAFYLWITEHLFEGNELVAGNLQVDGRTVDLGQIRCPVTILAGARDHITPPAQALALADHVGTPADQVCCDLVDGGHLGLFMGRAALRDHWQPLFGSLA